MILKQILFFTISLNNIPALLFIYLLSPENLDRILLFCGEKIQRKFNEIKRTNDLNKAKKNSTLI